MNTGLTTPPPFWKTVRLLLGAARKRSSGRQKRAQELLRHRNPSSIDWGPLGFLLGVLFMSMLQVFAAVVVYSAVKSGERIELEQQGKIVVSESFFENVSSLSPPYDDIGNYSYYREARDIAKEYGGQSEDIELKLRQAVRKHGTQYLVTSKAFHGLTAIAGGGRFPAMLGSIVLVWWGVMLVFQGEGLETDLQRRRHPMWEWLFSHPVPPGAVFLAEMLSPIAANPMYWGAPLFAGVLYGLVYGAEYGLLAAFAVGVPITIAAACLGKALEIGILLRFPPRSRGAIAGLMGWMGYTSMVLFLVGTFVLPLIVTATQKLLALFTVISWPWLGLFLGESGGSFSFMQGMVACWAVAGLTIVAGVWFSIWGTQQGLAGNVSAADTRPSARNLQRTSFGKDPLYRKEFLWFLRDRSAVVQAVLIPVTVAAAQLFNLRGILSDIQGKWNFLSGAAILFGTYFLFVLGPKSLTSEGTALWIALTWPRGLESLLKAKAWLWSMISSALVVLVLCYAAYLYPANIGQIALVAVGWYFFSRSMAEKSVTLVTVASPSGETEKLSWGRRWAVQLGMLTFSIGVLSQQWQLAVVGIVYSYLTAAAMWQNLRARLPYLYDPWSEELPPPPTLMHAMIAISILVEATAVITGITTAFAGADSVAVARAISYGVCACVVSFGVSSFLNDRGVSLSDIWNWRSSGETDTEHESFWQRHEKLATLLVIGAAGGLLLGLLAHGYLGLLEHFPSTAEILRKGREQMASLPGARQAYLVMAVLFAPFAEEYLFRGLLFRALDREWGGWRAVVGSAAFFAIYHPPMSWLPVVLLGISNAVLFKRTGSLWPAVALHMVYNAVVLIQ